ncbi:MAG: sigma-70 family RNA polymerase sigma factor [Bacteroidota bacterium]
MQASSPSQTIFSQIVAGGRGADEALQSLYKAQRHKVVAFLRKRGAEEEEALDVFQEAMIVVYENIQAGKFRGESSLSSYLHGVARFLWINRLKRRKTESRILEEQGQVDDMHMPRLLEKEKENEIRALFRELRGSCEEILVLSIFYAYNMQEIASHFAYSSEQIARNKKYRCMERLRELIEKQPAILSWLRS